MRELSGDPLNIRVVAQGADAPLDQSADAGEPARGRTARARCVSGAGIFLRLHVLHDHPPLEIPIGQLPLPNLRSGEALSGDYGVMQSVRVVIVNTSKFGQAIALTQTRRRRRNRHVHDRRHARPGAPSHRLFTL